MKIRQATILFIIGLVLVIVDQVVKILVKTNMVLGEAIPVIGNFFRICFVENEGMAFGMAWGGAVGKICLTIFRLGLFGFLWWWICKLLKKEDTPTGVLVGLTLIAAGALGNIIDCCFYGLIFSESTVWQAAHWGGSYAPFLMGKVVDMISFSIFPPVFNIADSCVTCGAIYLILFHWKFFSK